MEKIKLSYEPVVNVSLAKQISEKIMESITDGTLKAVDQLPIEYQLVSQFQVSMSIFRLPLNLGSLHQKNESVGQCVLDSLSSVI